MDNLKMFVLDECDKLLDNASKFKLVYNIHRHEGRHPKDFHHHSTQQAGYDVHRYIVLRYQGNLPQVYAQPD